MSRRRLGVLFIAMLALMLVLLLPLRLAIHAVDPAALGLSARDATGSVWSGHLHAAHVRGYPLGNVTVALRRWPLLRGVRQVQLTSDTLSFVLLGGRRTGIAEASGRVALGLDAVFGLDLQLHLADVGLRFSEGRCMQAEGTVEAELRFSGAPPIRLDGPVRCDGDNGVVALTAGASPAVDRIEAILRVDADGNYQVSSNVDPTDDAVSAALLLAGFRQTPSGLHRVDSGHLLR